MAKITINDFSNDSADYCYYLVPDFSVFDIAEKNYSDGTDSPWFTVNVRSDKTAITPGGYRFIVRSPYALIFNTANDLPNPAKVFKFPMNSDGYYIYLCVMENQMNIDRNAVTYNLDQDAISSLSSSMNIVEVYF
jgi:hypothetical protein